MSETKRPKALGYEYMLTKVKSKLLMDSIHIKLSPLWIK